MKIRRGQWKKQLPEGAQRGTFMVEVGDRWTSVMQVDPWDLDRQRRASRSYGVPSQFSIHGDLLMWWPTNNASRNAEFVYTPHDRRI